MTIIRSARPEAHFTQIRNEVLRDQRLSFKARGVLAYVLSMPDNWRSTAEDIASQGKEGRDAIRTALKELEELGYVQRRKVRGPDGRIATVTTIFDVPCAPETGYPAPDEPAAGEPTPDNPSSLEHCPKNTVKNTEIPPTPAAELELVLAEPVDPFDAWYESYPRKEAKPKARAAFKRAVKSAGLPLISAGLSRWVAYWEADQTERRFIPLPATWLNAERWNDQTPIPRNSSSVLDEVRAAYEEAGLEPGQLLNPFEGRPAARPDGKIGP
jgi:hypothetical protein